MGKFMDDYFRTVLEKTDAIKQAYEDLVKATLIAIGYQKGAEEAKAAAPPEPAPQERIDVSGNAAPVDTEGEMLIDLNGISVNSIPRKDGRYQGYVSVGGQKKYLYGKSAAEVEEKIRMFLRSARYALPQKRPPARPKTPAFGEFAKNWAENYKMPALKPKSYEVVLRVLKIATASFGAQPIGDITTDTLQAFFIGLGATRTRDLCAVYVGQIFAHAAKTGAIARNPMDAVQLPRREAEKRSALTPEQQAAFLAAARGCSQELLLRTLLATGLRIGEALALTPEDVDAERRTIRVNKDIVFLDDGRAVVQKPKTAASVRTIPVPDDICAQLAQAPGPRIFNIKYKAASLAFRRVSRACGVEVSAHILRHTYATRLEEAGIPPKVKQYLLGHATIEMTQGVYTDAQAHYVGSFSDRVRGTFTP